MTTILHNPFAVAARKGWTVLETKLVSGDGIQAPGAVTLCLIDGLHPYVVHFFNAQDGGFHSGDYCRDHKEAIAAFNQRARGFS